MIFKEAGKNPRYDLVLRTMIRVIESDYAGTALTEKPVDTQYYVQAAGQAWHDDKLDALLFMRLANQMTATTKDRTLKVGLKNKDYTPWHAGFDARRYKKSLYVTAIQGDDRLQAGDEITALNSNDCVTHMRAFQRNFLYGDTRDHELWHNVLKMTRHMKVRHADGREEDLPVKKFTTPRNVIETSVKAIKGGAVVLDIGTNPEQEKLSAFIDAHRTLIDNAAHLIIDLRHVSGDDLDAYIPLVPYVLNSAQSLDEAFGEQVWCTLYTDGNCARMTAALEEYAGNPEADALIAEYKGNSGAGWKENTIRLYEGEEDVIEPRGEKVTLLMDTFTENAAETFILMAKKQGRAKTAGRPTMGTTDFGDHVTVALNDEISLTYPISITLEAKEGHGYCGKGIEPDLLIPFTPEECTEDKILEAVLKQN